MQSSLPGKRLGQLASNVPDARTRFADPIFVDRANHDYHLKPDSPVLGLGFKEIDISEIGLNADFPYKARRRVSVDSRRK